MFKIGDFVTRNSYNNDIIFIIIDIDNNKATLKGMDVRLIADSPISDLVMCDKKINDDEIIDSINVNLDRNDYFYMPGKILHIDGDCEYLARCLKLYKKNNVLAYGICEKEEEMKNVVVKHLNNIKPDILVITGHDAYYKKNNDRNSLKSYLNSENFINTVIEARKYERAHDKLIIIAGACGSFYEALIKNGANFASSPKRINIHALDPAIIASSIAFSDRNQSIDIIKLIEKTKYGSDGIGGIITNGTMYVGYPR